MNAKAFETLGLRIAGLEFDRRSKGRPYRTTEAHLREKELAALLALAVEEGYIRGLAEGKREPMPSGFMTARGRLMALKRPAPAAPPPVEEEPSRPSDEDVRKALAALNGTVLAPAAGSGLPARISISCPQVDEKP